MGNWINIPIEQVDQAFLSDLRKRFSAGSRVELRVVEPNEVPSMSEDDFWGIIERLDWSKEKTEDILELAVEALSARPVAEIFLFEDLLAEKLQALDSPAHALAVYGDQDHISVDGFLYIRAAVLAEGKAYYEKVLQDASNISGDLDFEPILSLASRAYQKKTGKAFNYVSHISYETFNNKKNWQ